MYQYQLTSKIFAVLWSRNIEPLIEPNAFRIRIDMVCIQFQILIQL
jgi:hypothetical protein